MKGNKKSKIDFIKSLKSKVHQRIKEEGIKNLSKILRDIRNEYITKIKDYGVKDVEQSWKPFKGNLLEDIILKYIEEEVNKRKLKIVSGRQLETEDKNLSEELALVKRHLVVDYGKFGLHLPDADLVIYNPLNAKPVAIVSSKVTLRERVAQTGYWYLKLKGSDTTKNIKVYFVTLDEDGDLSVKTPSTKGRAIAETDTDGTYVITEQNIEESSKVKMIDKFLEDLLK